MEAGWQRGDMPSIEVRRARAAATAVFLLTGVVTASWSARIPAIQQRLGLSSAALGMVFASLEGGAVLGLPAAGALVARLGSGAGLRLGLLLYPPGLVAVAAAPGLGWLCAAVATMAAGNSLMDVAMNAQGVEVQRRYRRPVLSSMHAGHSFGVLAGAAGGTAAAAAGIRPLAHFSLVCVLALVTGATMVSRLLGEDRSEGAPLLLRPRGRLLVLGAAAFLVFLVDGAAENWSAVHLRGERGASAAGAAMGFTAFALGVAVARLVSDRLLARLGRVRFVRAAGVVTAAGAALAITAPTPVPAIAGWAVLGGGLGGIAPALLGAAPAVAGTSPPVAIAAVTTLGYLGAFTGPPLIGALAGVAGLSAALGALVAAPVLTTLLARGALGAARAGTPARSPTATRR
jgi:MFS family permease